MKLVRPVTVVAVVVSALLVPPAALAAGGVVGTYRTTIRDSGHLNGTWLLALAPGGTYAVSTNGDPLAKGRYSASAKTITFSHETNSGCTGRGVYAWKKSGRAMRFVRKRESPSCNARASVFEHRFIQVR
jgi:hypothetical protein